MTEPEFVTDPQSQAPHQTKYIDAESNGDNTNDIFFFFVFGCNYKFISICSFACFSWSVIKHVFGNGILLIKKKKNGRYHVSILKHHTNLIMRCLVAVAVCCLCQRFSLFWIGNRFRAKHYIFRIQQRHRRTIVSVCGRQERGLRIL